MDWQPIETAPRASWKQLLCYADGWGDTRWLSFSDGCWSDEDSNTYDPEYWLPEPESER